MAELGEILSNAMVVGDTRKHLSVILALKTHTELVGSQEPSDLLHPDVVKFLEKHGYSVRTVEDVVAERNPVLEQIITEGLERANKAAQSTLLFIGVYSLFIMALYSACNTGLSIKNL